MMGMTSGRMGMTSGRFGDDKGDDLRDDGDDMSSLFSLRCRGSHVFPIFLEMSGKSCLPYFP